MRQLKIDFEPGLSRRHRNVLEVVAGGVYRHGLERTAGAIDEAKGNLSLMLSGSRNFPLDKLERYIDETGDLSPVYYLVERYLQTSADRRQRAVDELASIMPQIQRLLEDAK